MTLARRLATGDTYAVFVTSRMRTETRASSASVYVSSVLARKMAAEMREATCAGTQTSKAPTLSGPSVTNHYSVPYGKDLNGEELKMLLA